MKRNAGSLLVAVCLSGLGGIVQAEERPIVAVFDLEVRGPKFDAETRSRLTDYLGSLMARKGFRVVPRSQLKERLTQAKKDSYKECYEQTCQIEVGKELAAQKSLASQVLKIGTKCKVTVNLFDLRRAASDGAGAGSGECDEDHVVASLENAVEDLFGGGTAPIGAPATAEEPVAPPVDDKLAYRRELEKAWKALTASVRKAGAEDQLEKYQGFLASYPVDNPHAGKAQKAIDGLEARLAREAEARRQAEEKAAALAAERKRAADMKKAHDDARAKTGKAAEQLEAWKKFLTDYPDRNPYLKTANRKISELEAQAKKEAAEEAARVCPAGYQRLEGGSCVSCLDNLIGVWRGQYSEPGCKTDYVLDFSSMSLRVAGPTCANYPSVTSVTQYSVGKCSINASKLPQCSLTRTSSTHSTGWPPDGAITLVFLPSCVQPAEVLLSAMTMGYVYTGNQISVQLRR